MQTSGNRKQSGKVQQRSILFRLSFQKSDTATIEKIKRAIQAAYTEGEAKLKGTVKLSRRLVQLNILYVTVMLIVQRIQLMRMLILLTPTQ